MRLTRPAGAGADAGQACSPTRLRRVGHWSSSGRRWPSGWVRSGWGACCSCSPGCSTSWTARWRARGTSMTIFGAFYDSTLDRVGESALFAGIALHFLQRRTAARAASRWAVMLAIAALAASLLVSYTRARAEGLGIECKVGIAARAERILVLGAPTLLFGAGPGGALLLWIVAVLALATVITVIQRIVHVARVDGAAPGAARCADAGTRSPGTPRSFGKDTESWRNKLRRDDRARQGQARRAARRARRRRHDLHRRRGERPPRQRAADRLADPDGHDPARQAHRQAAPRRSGTSCRWPTSRIWCSGPGTRFPTTPTRRPTKAGVLEAASTSSRSPISSRASGRCRRCSTSTTSSGCRAPTSRSGKTKRELAEQLREDIRDVQEDARAATGW